MQHCPPVRILVAMTLLTIDNVDRSAIGSRIEDLDTPSLLLDLPACDRNLRRMAQTFAHRKAKLRPHFKNHKCVTLARRQLAAGSAVGLTCAKLGEAEVLADAGFPDVLIANQVVGARKVARLIEVAKKTNLKVAVDHLDQVAAISDAASAAGVKVGILVEVDIGMGRCGVQPGQPALELAQQIAMMPGIHFLGIQAYEGHVVYINDEHQRGRLATAAMQKAIDTREFIEEHGIHVSVVSGSSTGTYRQSGFLDGIDEIQAGTYATMDWRYQEVVPEFEVALSVLARVISKREGEAVIDIGVKGAGGEFGLPKVKGAPDIDIPFFLAEEHCVIRKAPNWRVGEPIHLIPSHACTTCNLHRQMFVHEDGIVVDVWPIEASGKLA